MSYIIEDTGMLNLIANTIINANKSVNEKTATKSELIEYIKGIVPESSCFSSGVIIPATEISINNMPEVMFNLGSDENGDVIVPDIIFIYQPQPIKDGLVFENVSFFTMLCPGVVRIENEQTNCGVSLYKQTSGSLVGGSIFGANYLYTRVTENSFFVAPSTKYPFKAQLPIVWMQIKL